MTMETVEELVRSKDGKTEPLTLGKLTAKNMEDRIKNRMVLLPPKVGGLKGGLLMGDRSERPGRSDVAS